VKLPRATHQKEIWAELQRQLDERGLKISKGVIQDATFIKAYQGRKRKAEEKS